jgi:hypothetical protein
MQRAGGIGGSNVVGEESTPPEVTVVFSPR